MVLCFSHSIFRSHKSRDLKNDLGIFICVEKPLPGPSDSSRPPGAGVQSGSEGHTWAPHTHDTTCCGWKSLHPGPQHCSGFPPCHTPFSLGNSSRDTNPHPQSPLWGHGSGMLLGRAVGCGGDHGDRNETCFFISRDVGMQWFCSQLPLLSSAERPFRDFCCVSVN